MATPTENKTHLFISYAIEDAELAEWLARKLGAQGYAVWFDQMKLLGGEPWPQTIDEAIKMRTFRMIALLSKHSLNKPNPSKERTLALDIARRSRTPDFLITLKVDDAQLDWLTTDISYISFNRGWAEGWKKLLKKLDSVSAPKILQNAGPVAASTFPRGDDLIRPGEEQVHSNVIRVAHFPEVLKVYSVRLGLDGEQKGELRANWPHYRINDLTLVSLIPPPSEFSKCVEATTEQCLWTYCELFHGVKARDIAANLAVRSLEHRLKNAGCHENRKRPGTFYLTSDFTTDGKLHFDGFRGKTWRKIRGRVTFWRGAGKKELNFFNFAFRLRLARGLDKSFYIQITPTLVFFTDKGKLITDSSVGSRRKRLTKMWWNDEWLNRLLAAQQLLCGLAPASDQDVILEPTLLSARSSVVLDERRFDEGGAGSSTEEEDPQLEVQIDEQEQEADHD